MIIDLGKIRFNFTGIWFSSVTYELNDVATYGGNTYVYTNATPSSGVLPTNVGTWTLMLAGVSFQGPYSVTTQYHIGQAVSYGGSVYFALQDNLGVVITNTAYWQIFNSGVRFEGAYLNTTQYLRNDIVTYGGQVYIAIADSLGVPITTAASWQLYTAGLRFQGIYSASAQYLANDMVVYGGKVYIAVVDNIGQLVTNATYWSVFSNGVRFNGSYGPAIQYFKGDIVNFGACAYVALQDTLGNDATSVANWSILLSGFRFLNAYAGGTAYIKGDVVTYENGTYIALGDTTGNLPTVVANWAPMLQGLTNRGAWVTGTVYNIYDLVEVNGNSTYICTTQHTSSAAFTTDLATKWQVVALGLNNRGSWTAAATYSVNDFVQRGGQTFVCTVNNIASAAFVTDMTTKWALLSGGVRWTGPYVPATSYLIGDLASDGVSTWIAVIDFVAGTSIALDGNTKWSLHAQGTGNNVVLISSATNLLPGYQYMCNTTAGPFTVTLPPAPTAGNQVIIGDVSRTFNINNLTIANNGSNIDSINDVLVANLQGLQFTLTYINSTIGWSYL